MAFSISMSHSFAINYEQESKFKSIIREYRCFTIEPHNNPILVSVNNQVVTDFNTNKLP